jgi:hypothetical protein
VSIRESVLHSPQHLSTFKANIKMKEITTINTFININSDFAVFNGALTQFNSCSSTPGRGGSL